MVIHHFYGSDDMLVLITYDVSTQTQAGVRRLRKVAKVCENYGQRVQNSVFECLLDSAQLKFVKAKLLDIMDKKEDSIRIYYLGNNFENKIEHYGVKQGYNPEGLLML